MSDLWFKLAVDFPTHPKVIRAGSDAAWLAVCAMAYCRKHLTDGVLPAAVVPTLAAVKRPMILASKLVEVGLWETAPDAFIVHDFLQWNPSREEVEANRDKWRDKKKNQRSVPEGHTEGHSQDSSEIPHVCADAPARSAHSASLSSMPLVAGLEGSLRGTERAERQKYGRPLVGSPLEHRSHGWCNQRGLCLPASLYAELLGRLGGPERERDLIAWLGATIDALDATVPGETVWVFWRSRFEAWQGSTAPTTKGARTMAAGARLQTALDAGAELDPFGTKRIAREKQARIASEEQAALTAKAAV